jgi:hypothetical protein
MERLTESFAKLGKTFRKCFTNVFKNFWIAKQLTRGKRELVNELLDFTNKENEFCALTGYTFKDFIKLLHDGNIQIK